MAENLDKFALNGEMLAYLTIKLYSEKRKLRQIY